MNSMITINWNIISRQKNLNAAFIREHQHRLNWTNLSSSHMFSETELEEFKDYLEWKKVAFRQQLSLPFILAHWNRLPLLLLKRNERIHLQQEEWDILLEKEKKELYQELEKGDPNWYFIFSNFFLEESFMEDNMEIVNWLYVSEWQVVSENFIRKHKDTLRWDSICRTQNLSEEFMIEMKDVVKWKTLSVMKHFTEPFMEKMSTYIDWDAFKFNVCFSDKQKEDYIKKYQKESVI